MRCRSTRRGTRCRIRNCRSALLLSFAFALFRIVPGSASPPETGVVEEVVDGDTVRIRTSGSAEAVTVRMIGIDAPERGHPGVGKEFLSDEAAAFLSSLCMGKTVRMEKDDEEVDKYGRLLRYLFLPSPDGRLLNAEMLRAGMARAYPRFPFRRKTEFLDAERGARREGKGLWRDEGMAEARWLSAGNGSPVQVYPAGGKTFVVSYRGFAKTGVERGDLPKEIDGIIRLSGDWSDAEFAAKARDRGFRPVAPTAEERTRTGGSPKTAPNAAAATVAVVPWEEAHLHEGEEIVVEGTIVRTHRTRNVVYLNFHPNWKRYLTVVVFVNDLPRFPIDPEEAYRGRRVRVRGEVKRFKGRPEMVVRAPGEITALP